MNKEWLGEKRRDGEGEDEKMTGRERIKKGRGVRGGRKYRKGNDEEWTKRGG